MSRCRRPVKTRLRPLSNRYQSPLRNHCAVAGAVAESLGSGDTAGYDVAQVRDGRIAALYTLLNGFTDRE
jgi:hypothetical protein